MRYGRNIFVKFHDGAKARAWLRDLLKRVNARSQEHKGQKIHGQHRFHLRRAEGARALSAVAGQLSRGVPGRHARPRTCWSVMSGHMRRSTGRAASAVLTSTRWPGYAPTPTRVARRRCRSFAPRWRRSAASRSGSSRTRRRSRTRTGSGPRASTSVTQIRSRSRRSRAGRPRRIPATACWRPDGTWRPLKPGEFLLGYEDEIGPDGTQAPEPRGAETERHLHGLPQALSGRRRVSPILDDGREVALRVRRRVPPGARGGQDDGSLAQRVSAGSVAR